MGRLDMQEFVCLDCETTGLDPDQDRIIEVAAVRFTLSDIIGQYDALVNPECEIPEASIAFHHITQDMVYGKPTMREVLPSLLEFLGESSLFIGHGVQFDIQIVINAALREKIPHRLRTDYSLDTLRMARLYGESPVNSLDQLRRHFNIPYEGTHRALSDALVNMEVFRRLAKEYRTTEEIFKSLSKPIMFKAMPLGKHKGRLLKDIPLDYLLWAARQEFDNDLLYSLRSEINRRKKGNLFSQASNPFGDL